jgi:hypothetical protein
MPQLTAVRLPLKTNCRRWNPKCLAPEGGEPIEPLISVMLDPVTDWIPREIADPVVRNLDYGGI